MYYDLYESELGTLAVVCTDKGLTRIIHCQTRPESVFTMKQYAEFSPKKLSDIMQSIKAYIAGEIKHLDIPLDLRSGTDLQKRVWERLTEIPYGERISYTKLAEDVGKPKAVRAVASACGANPVPVVVPCHRVVSKDGSLGGFAWGIDKKEWLLALEDRILRENRAAA